MHWFSNNVLILERHLQVYKHNKIHSCKSIHFYPNNNSKKKHISRQNHRSVHVCVSPSCEDSHEKEKSPSFPFSDHVVVIVIFIIAIVVVVVTICELSQQSRSDGGVERRQSDTMVILTHREHNKNNPLN